MVYRTVEITWSCWKKWKIFFSILQLIEIFLNYFRRLWIIWLSRKPDQTFSVPIIWPYLVRVLKFFFLETKITFSSQLSSQRKSSPSSLTSIREQPPSVSIRIDPSMMFVFFPIQWTQHSSISPESRNI